MAESSAVNHPIGGRRRKCKGPAQQPPSPDLPPIPAGDDSSDALEDEKRRNDRAPPQPLQSQEGVLEPHECYRFMGIHTVGSSSEDGVWKESESRRAIQKNQSSVTYDYNLRVDFSSGAVEGSRAVESASLARSPGA